MDKDRTVYDLLVHGYAGGWIQTPELARKIAKVLVCDYYDEIEWEAVQPLDIALEGDVWSISTGEGRRNDQRLTIKIAKRDGAIRRFEIQAASFDALEATRARLNRKWKDQRQSR